MPSHWTKTFAGLLLVAAPGAFALAIGSLCVHGYVYGDTIHFGLLSLLLVIQSSWYAFMGLILVPLVMWGTYFKMGDSSKALPKNKWMSYTMSYSFACLIYTLMPTLAVALSYHVANQDSKDQYNKDFSDQLSSITTDLAAYAKFLANCVLGILTEMVVTFVSFQYWTKMNGAIVK